MHTFQINAIIQFKDAKNLITALIWKACIFWYIITMHSTKSMRFENVPNAK
jgi:hypothetical protein